MTKKTKNTKQTKTEPELTLAEMTKLLKQKNNDANTKKVPNYLNY